MIYRTIKHIIDFISALLAFTILSPVFFILLIILLIVNRGSAFFLQERPGKNEKIFKIIKFKTMRDQKPNEYAHNLNRVTKVGNIIRKYSLDEIPQLINVIKGDMSIVGPRPLLVKYLPLYNKRQKKRHNVRPGITGWAQVKGRNAISWDQKFEHDVYYVENQSLTLDIKVILLTIKRLIKPEGINNNDNLNMPEFIGSK